MRRGSQKLGLFWGHSFDASVLLFTAEGDSLRLAGTIPTMVEENLLYEQGYHLVAGVDEVGRGPLAGPVVAAAIILPKNLKGSWVSRIRDSKQLTPAQRDYLFPHLQESALAVGVGRAEHWEIDEVRIVEATRRAMKRAIDSLSPVPEFLLIDALQIPDAAIGQRGIIHGDVLCLSIAAASIVAKVARDRLMREEDELYPGYGFKNHKGYATPRHLDALQRLGPCRIHRRSFYPISEIVSRGHGY